MLPVRERASLAGCTGHHKRVNSPGKVWAVRIVVILLCIAYVALFKTLGYVLDSFIVCFIIMVLIGKRKWVQMVLISLLVPLCMWLLFYLLLKVNIPMGPLTFLRDLIDEIL